MIQVNVCDVKRSHFYTVCIKIFMHHLGYDSVHDEGLNGSDMTLWVVDSDEDVFGAGIMLLLIILL